MANRVVKLAELTHYNEESYAYPMPLITPIEADKSKSISEMTLDELRRLIGRLRDEREAEDIIRSLRRSAGQKDTFENPAKIDTKTPIDQLYHYGIPGMKWGVRKQRKLFKGETGYISPRATLSRIDQKEQDFLDDPKKVYSKIYARAASQIRKGTRLLNKDPRFANKDFKEESPLRSQYYSEYSKMVTDQLNRASVSKAHIFTSRRLGMSPHKTLQMKLTFDYEKELRASYDISKSDVPNVYKKKKKDTANQAYWKERYAGLVKPGVLAQSADGENTEENKIIELEIECELEPSGYIREDKGVIFHSEIDDSVFSDIENSIKHWGILGMHWGVRRFQKENGRRTPAGKKRDADNEFARSEDHIKSRENKMKGPASLSNEELKRLNERLKLEVEYKTLTTEKIDKAESFVGEQIKKAAGSALTTFATGVFLGAAKTLVKEISPSFAEVAGFGTKAAPVTPTPEKKQVKK